MLGAECSSPRFAPAEGMEIVITALLHCMVMAKERDRLEESSRLTKQLLLMINLDIIIHISAKPKAYLIGWYTEFQRMHLFPMCNVYFLFP